MSEKAAYQPPSPVVYPSVDWQLEEFLSSLQTSGQLTSLRAVARASSEQRRLAVAMAERDAAAAARGDASGRRHGISERDDEEEEEEEGGFESERDEWERWTHRHEEGEEEEDASTSTDSEWLDCEPDFHDVSNGVGRASPAAAGGGGTLALWAMRLGGGARQRAGQETDLVIGCDETIKDESCQGQGQGQAQLSKGVSDGGEEQVVTMSDLHDFVQDLSVHDDDLAKNGWRQTLNRKTDRFSCRAWSRDPPGGGPTVFRCHMVIRECSAEAARDFFLDEDYRQEWDDARAQASQMLEEWDPRGECVARWVRKFPFFLRDREYVVARRVWSLRSRTYHCVSKLTAHPSAPLRPNPLRVSAFDSKWRVAPVTDAQQIAAVWGAQASQGKRGNRQAGGERSQAQKGSCRGGNNACCRQTCGDERGKGKCGESPATDAQGEAEKHGCCCGEAAAEGLEQACIEQECVEQACDVVTIHAEDSGVSRNIAKMGVARGMWSHVVKMEAALHAYVKAGRNAKHSLPMFLLHADAMHAAANMRSL